MKNEILKLVYDYLNVFPEENKRQEKLIEFLNSHNDDEITDRNNFNGHITASGIIYASKERMFLMLHHKTLDMFLFPGGHTEKKDENPLETAKREVREETGLENLEQLKITYDNLVPIEIDTHVIEYNKKRNLPEHYHFDFRYLFILDEKVEIKIDEEESTGYKWIGIDDLYNDKNYGKIAFKLEEILKKDKIIL